MLLLTQLLLLQNSKLASVLRFISSLQTLKQMAYASVASLLQTVDILLNHHQNSISLQFTNQITLIHQHTCSLRSFLESFSDRVDNWEETIRQVTNKTEDIIELLLSDSLLESSVESDEVSYSFDELEKVTEEIETIAARVKGARRVETVVGSYEEFVKIASRLVEGSSSVEAIAICGGGGLGKTTLASNAYFHPQIEEYFDVRGGSTVTREYTWVRVMADLLRCMRAEFSSSDSEVELIQRFLRVVGRRRYLLMFDDIWSFEVLERLNFMLPDYGNGSRIIFTTRSPDLAKLAHHVHEMSLLDEDKSWNLLREKIFKGDPCPFRLESIGKTIARSCGGHPLSIAVVSGILLASDQTEASWADVSENIKIAFEEGGDKVDEIVYLSYVCLPHHLRPCLLYFGLHPEHRQLYVPGLVKVWAAEGFVIERGYKSLEETGEGYVEDLVTQGLISVHSWKSNGGIKSVTVHDLIRGMCLRQARIDNFNLHYDRDFCNRPHWEVKEIMNSCRRVCNFMYSDDFLSGVYGSTIRTLVLHSEQDKLDLKCWMGNVRLLRILDLSSVNDYDLSGDVFELIHLRYLVLHRELSIPEDIPNLVNLQTLVIGHSTKGGIFDKVPEGIWRMPQLRHLCIYSFKFPNRTGKTSTALESLQTLSKVVDFVCSRENLRMFVNVKNLDLLYNSRKLRDVVEDYELHNLAHLQKLEVLKLETKSSVGDEQMSCAFPLTLKRLSLRGLRLSWADMKMVALLPNLEVLKLRNHACVGNTWETSEGGFSRLKYLLIEESNLENWITNSSHFPRLKWLVLFSCLSLLEVPSEVAEILTLHVIDLDGTNRSLLSSAKRIQQDRRSLGHDHLLQIRVI